MKPPHHVTVVVQRQGATDSADDDHFVADFISLGFVPPVQDAGDWSAPEALQRENA